MSPSVAILSAAMTVFALVLSIFGASWLNQRNTEKLVEQLGQRLDQRIDSLEKRFDQRLDSVDQRLERMERQLEAIFKPSSPNEQSLGLYKRPNLVGRDLKLDCIT